MHLVLEDFDLRISFTEVGLEFSLEGIAVLQTLGESDLSDRHVFFFAYVIAMGKARVKSHPTDPQRCRWWHWRGESYESFWTWFQQLCDTKDRELKDKYLKYFSQMIKGLIKSILYIQTIVWAFFRL